MATHYLRPNADGDKAEWDSNPAGADWSCIDDPVLQPNPPSLTDYVYTTTTNELCRTRYETVTPERPVQSVTAWGYVRPGVPSVRLDVKTGGTYLAQGQTMKSSGGLEFGFNEDFDQWYARDGHVAGAPVAANCGASVCRVPIYWWNHEPTQGNYVWNEFTTGPYNAIVAAGMTPMFCCVSAPTWASDPSPNPSNLRVCRPANIPQFANFVEALMDQYPQALVQIQNEPNYSLFNGIGYGPVHFANMTNAASQAVQPRQVIAPATSPGGEQEASSFYNTMWDAITEDAYVDPSCHVYPGAGNFTTDINNWLTRLNDRGGSDHRGWITEAGFHQTDHGGAANQVARSRYLYEQAAARPIQGLIFHRFRTSNQNAWEVAGDFGIVNRLTSGANFVTNDLYTGLAAERASDPNVGQGAGTWRWVGTTYQGTLSQAQIDALETELVSGGDSGVDAAICAAVYLQVQTQSSVPGTPVIPTSVVSGIGQGVFQRSHKVAVRVDVLDRNGNKLGEIPNVADGQVTYDAKAGSRGRMDLTIQDTPEGVYVPTDYRDWLAPFGNELQVFRGVETPSGVQLVSLGIFGIDRVEATDDGEGGFRISVSGLDRSQRFIEQPLEAPLVFPAGTQLRDAIIFTLWLAWPNFAYNFIPIENAPLPLIRAEEGDDRWEFAIGLAQSIGCELFFNDDGVCILRSVPQNTGNPVAAYNEGPDGVLMGVSRAWDRALTWNKVIVTGTSSTLDGVPPRAALQDANLNSPTYYDGPFGKKTYFWSSPYVQNGFQAALAAASLLQRVTGRPDIIDFQAIVDPGRRPGDVISITRERSVGLVNERHVLDSVSIPLSAEGVMSASTRVFQVLEIGTGG